MMIFGFAILSALIFLLGMLVGSAAERNIQKEENTLKQEGADFKSEFKNFLSYDGTEQE